MQAQTSPRQTTSVFAWVIAVFGVILMLLLLLSFMADARRSATSEVAGTTSNRVAYLQFGLTADTLRIADPAAPDESSTLLVIPHAAEYGILPSISPDGRRFAYTALPEGLASPQPTSPAKLWLASIDDEQPHLLAEAVDLLVRPVWAPDGESLVYRRSTTSTHTLALNSASGGEERIVAYSETESLFPVAFADGSDRLLYVGLSNAGGSHLYEVDLGTGIASLVATLSDGLTREWTLSPDGTRLAFLEIAFSESEVASRASVLDLGSGALTAITSTGETAFGPTWSNAGALAVGTFNPSTVEASLLVIDGNSRTRIAVPASGFDVPLEYNPAADAYLVSSFENNSITSPGRSVLTLVGSNGERKLIAEGEVTLVGWTHP